MLARAEANATQTIEQRSFPARISYMYILQLQHPRPKGKLGSSSVYFRLIARQSFRLVLQLDVLLGVLEEAFLHER